MHFSQAVAIIQSQVGLIRGVQVLYSDTVIIIFFGIITINLYINIILFSESASCWFGYKFTSWWNTLGFWSSCTAIEVNWNI